MSFADEFAAVDWLVQSELETSAVDAFALALIKAERQIRRIFTYAVFQNGAFSSEHVIGLRNTLTQNRRCYLEGFERGIDALLHASVRAMVGNEYAKLRAMLDDAIEVRNKIFHGQLTDRRLSRGDLLQYVRQVRRWCELLAAGAAREVGYDGFGRNSFRKGPLSIPLHYRQQIVDLSGYERFLRTHVERR